MPVAKETFHFSRSSFPLSSYGKIPIDENWWRVDLVFGVISWIGFIPPIFTHFSFRRSFINLYFAWNLIKCPRMSNWAYNFVGLFSKVYSQVVVNCKECFFVIGRACPNSIYSMWVLSTHVRHSWSCSMLWSKFSLLQLSHLYLLTCLNVVESIGYLISLCKYIIVLWGKTSAVRQGSVGCDIRICGRWEGRFRSFLFAVGIQGFRLLFQTKMEILGSDLCCVWFMLRCFNIAACELFSVLLHSIVKCAHIDESPLYFQQFYYLRQERFGFKTFRT